MNNTETLVKPQNPARTYTRSTDSAGRGYGTGRGKKHSVAKVWAKYNGMSVNRIIINDKPAQEYLSRATLVAQLEKPINDAFNDIKVDINITTFGGGKSGQARAARLGIARALVILNGSARLALREGGYLTRDSRIAERMKAGQPGARAKFPYNRR